MGSGRTVVGPGGVVAVVVTAERVVVGGGVGGGVGVVIGGVEGAVVSHTDEARVGVSDHSQDQVGGSASLSVSGLAAGFSHPDSGGSGQEPVGVAQDRVRCTHPVEGRGVERAWEGEGKYNDARTSHTSEHWMGEDMSNPLEEADTERVEGGDHGMGGGREEVMNPEPVREPEQAPGDVGDEIAVEGNVQAAQVDNDRTQQVDPSRMEGGHSFHTGSGEGEVHTLQADQVERCDNGVKGVEVGVAAQVARTNNFHDGRTARDQRAVGSGKSV